MNSIMMCERFLRYNINFLDTVYRFNLISNNKQILKFHVENLLLDLTDCSQCSDVNMVLIDNLRLLFHSSKYTKKIKRYLGFFFYILRRNSIYLSCKKQAYFTCLKTLIDGMFEDSVNKGRLIFAILFSTYSIKQNIPDLNERIDYVKKISDYIISKCDSMDTSHISWFELIEFISNGYFNNVFANQLYNQKK